MRYEGSKTGSVPVWCVIDSCFENVEKAKKGRVPRRRLAPRDLWDLRRAWGVCIVVDDSKSVSVRRGRHLGVMYKVIMGMARGRVLFESSPAIDIAHRF